MRNLTGIYYKPSLIGMFNIAKRSSTTALHIRRHRGRVFEIYGQLADKHSTGNLHNTLWIRLKTRGLEQRNQQPLLADPTIVHMLVREKLLHYCLKIRNQLHTLAHGYTCVFIPMDAHAITCILPWPYAQSHIYTHICMYTRA